MSIVGPESTGFLPASLAESALFDDRTDAGQRLAHAVPADLAAPVVVALTHGGVEIGVPVATALHAPIDAAMVAKIRHPGEPDYVIGAVAPGGATQVTVHAGLSEVQVVLATARARAEAARCDAKLHGHHVRPRLEGRTAVLVDEAITTGATMLAAIEWAHGARAAQVVAAVPVAASAGLALVRARADRVICLCEFEYLGARSVWFGDFPPLGDDDVLRLLEARR